MGTDDTNTLVRTARPDHPEWQTFHCGISFLVKWHGAGHEEVKIVFRIPKGVDGAEAKEGRA